MKSIRRLLSGMGLGLTAALCLGLSIDTAQAATILDMEGGGTVTYSSTGPSFDLYNGTITPTAYFDLTPVRNYSLAFDIDVDPSDTRWNGADTIALGAFSLTDIFTTPGDVDVFTDSTFTWAPASGGDFSFSLALGASDSTYFRNLINVSPSITTGTRPFTFNASFIAPVPLPASLPLLLAGIGGFAALRRRKKKAA